MPTSDGVLSPNEAARIATNAYFTLKDWINETPVAAVESAGNIHNRVLGAGNAGSGAHANTSLAGSRLAGGSLHSVHSAKTGFGTESGFGYTLSFDNSGQKHLVVATRGTRPEMKGMPDLITDIRGSMASFADFGPVHKGFKKTFDSIVPELGRDKALIDSAHSLHFVGHSLGGAVATLLAARYAAAGKSVKLYTFGSPRVGCFTTYDAIQRKIGPGNIFRVAHDLDPISLIAPYPYIHVQPAPADRNNMTLLSPTGKLLSTANHDMGRYIESVGAMGWNGVRGRAAAVDHDNALIARWLLHKDNDAGWVQYASAHTLALLFKLFSHVLKGISTALILGLTAVDLLAEILMKGLHTVSILGSEVLQLLKYAAQWAGIVAVSTADFTAQIVKAILNKMLTVIKDVAIQALANPQRYIAPMTIALGAWQMTASSAF